MAKSYPSKKAKRRAMFQEREDLRAQRKMYLYSIGMGARPDKFKNIEDCAKAMGLELK